MILYAKSNSSRKKEFQLFTRIVEADGVRKVEKGALTVEAAEFNRSFKTKYDLIHSYTNLPFVVVPCEVANDIVTFDYIEGGTYFWEMERLVLAGDSVGFNALFDEYRQKIIYALPHAERVASSERIGIFGDSLEQEEKWVSPGVLDLNLDNLIRSADGAVLFDYEWTWDFALPADFIVCRALTNFVYSLAGKGIDVSALQTLFESVIKPEYIDAEYCFNEYVNGHGHSRDEFAAIHFDFTKLAVSRPDFLADVRLKIPALESKVTEQNEMIEDLQKQLQSKSAVLARRAVKAAVKLTNALGKITPK